MNDYWELKRKDTDEKILFPQDMRWLDEFNHSKLAQSTPKRTVSGATVVQQGLKKGGRKITLGGEWVWHNRSDFKLLQAWSCVPKLVMTLTHYDESKFDVYFRNHEGAIDCKPVLYQTPEPDDAKYTGQIRLITTVSK